MRKVGILDIMGFIASLATLASMVMFFIRSDDDKYFYLAFYGGCLFCVITLAILLIKERNRNNRLLVESGNRKDEILAQKNILGEASKKLSGFEHIVQHTHNISHQGRQISFRLYNVIWELLSVKEYDESEIKALQYKFDNALINILSNIRDSFIILTGTRNCSVYISLIDMEKSNFAKEEFFVKTKYRDPLSYRKRRIIDDDHQSFDVKHFTPYKELLDVNANISYFAEDNCMDRPNYTDIIDDWNKYYTACLSIPIRLRSSDSSSGRVNILGFLSVDNKSGSLNNNLAIELLCNYADQLYILLAMYEDCKGNMELQLKKEKS